MTSPATTSKAASHRTRSLIGFPKPLKKDRPNEKRKRKIKRKDRAFQKDIPPGARCLVPNCPNPPTKHHKIKRRRVEFRWSNDNAALLCWIPHHSELEHIGERAFCEKYSLPYPL